MRMYVYAHTHAHSYYCRHTPLALYTNAAFHHCRRPNTPTPPLYTATAIHRYTFAEFSLFLECGCHLTGGYFAHPMGREFSINSLKNLSLPFGDIYANGNVVLRKLPGSGGNLLK